MKLKIKVASCALIVVFFSANVLTDINFGIGTRVATFLSFGTGGSTTISTNILSFPIKVDDIFTFEPEIIYTSSKEKDSDSNTDRLKTKGISLGVFGFIKSESQIKPYYGARVGMSKFESEYQSGI